MKSKKNLTRYTYETGSVQGWRLCLSVTGNTFHRYFTDRKLGGETKALAAAEKALKQVRKIIDNSRRVDGKITAATVKQVRMVLKDSEGS